MMPPKPPPRRTRRLLISEIPTERVRLWEKIITRSVDDAILNEMLSKVEVYFLLGDKEEDDV